MLYRWDANAGPRVPSGGVTLKRRCTYRPSVIYLIVNKLLSLSLSLSTLSLLQEKGRDATCHVTLVCVLSVYLKDTEPSPLQDSSGVRQKGGIPGPHPESRIHCCPGGVYRGPIAQVGSGPNFKKKNVSRHWGPPSSPGLLQSPIL